MRFLLTLVLLTATLPDYFAQSSCDSINAPRYDSLNKKLKADSLRTFRFKKFRPYANVDNRNSFIRHMPVNVNGIQLGVMVNERHVFGLGFYSITPETRKPRKTNDNVRKNAVGQLSLNYATFAYQYVLLDKRFLEIDLPFEIGYGRYNLKIQDQDTKAAYPDLTAPIVPLGAGVQVVLKPVRWVGFSTMGGYRYVKDDAKNLNFSGFYYSLGLWVDIRQIYRDLKYGFIKRKYKAEVRRLGE